MSTQPIASPPRQETPPFERSASYRSGAPLQQHSSHKYIIYKFKEYFLRLTLDQLDGQTQLHPIPA